VRYPAVGADHPLPPECHDDQQRLEDAEFSRTHGRIELTARDEQPVGGVPMGNGPRKK